MLDGSRWSQFVGNIYKFWSPVRPNENARILEQMPKKVLALGLGKIPFLTTKNFGLLGLHSSSFTDILVENLQTWSKSLGLESTSQEAIVTTGLLITENQMFSRKTTRKKKHRHWNPTCEGKKPYRSLSWLTTFSRKNS